MDPQKLRYTKSHEWVSLEGDVCTVGITTYAAQQLSDVTYIELPHVGDHVFAGKSFGELETVKAVSDLFAPCDGEVIAVNDKVIEDPNLVPASPMGDGWLIKVRVEDTANALKDLLTLEQYNKQIESEGH